MDKKSNEIGRVWSKERSIFFAKIITICIIIAVLIFLYLLYGITPRFILNRFIRLIIIRYKRFSIKDAFLKDSEMISSDTLMKPYFVVFDLIISF